jgi:hypothetical protein
MRQEVERSDIAFESRLPARPSSNGKLRIDCGHNTARLSWPASIGCGVAAQSLYRVGHLRWIDRAVVHAGSLAGRVLPANSLSLPVAPPNVTGVFRAQVFALASASGAVIRWNNWRLEVHFSLVRHSSMADTIFRN